jgi:arylsulfatase A-like enzyme
MAGETDRPAPRIRFTMISICLLLALFAPADSLADPPEGRPNVLILHTDEHNFRTLGCYRKTLSREQALMWGESVVETPNIDWLAETGALCTSFYATSPVCSPSRAALVSGCYPQNTSVVGNDIAIDDDVITFAEILRHHGYATGYAGKWHLDGKGKPQWEPERNFGFEDNRYMFNRGHWKQLEVTEAGPRVKARNKKGKPAYSVEGADENSFATDFLTDRAIEFIEERSGEPFCYMVSYPDPHGPDTVRAPYDEMYATQEYTEPRTFDEPLKGAPSWAKPGGKFRSMSRYYGMVKCIDDNVGRILDTLREKDLIDETIVIFTSDHGDLRGEHHRQNKGVPFEGSAKVPFIIRHPDLIAAGTTIDEALGTVDFKSTICGILGVEVTGKTEGRDASLLFTTGEAPPSWNDVTFVRQASREGAGWLAAVTDRYKLILSPGDDPWLLDLFEDPDELKNYFADPEYRQTARELARELALYGETYGDPYAANPDVAADLRAVLGISDEER